MPHTQDDLPFNGSSLVAQHASWTGAESALKTRSANLTMLRQLWREPMTMQRIAAISGLSLSSVCSLKSLLEDELVFVDFEFTEWPGRKPTKRCRWQLRRDA